MNFFTFGPNLGFKVVWFGTWDASSSSSWFPNQTTPEPNQWVTLLRATGAFEQFWVLAPGFPDTQEEGGTEMSKEKHVGGLDTSKTQAELATALKDFLTKAAPDGLGIDAAKIDKISVVVDASGKPRGFGFFEAADDVATAVDVTGKDVTGLGRITIKDRRPKPAPAPAPTPAPTPPAATPPAAPPPPPATPATPAAPARRTTTPRTTATRTITTRGSPDTCWKALIGLGVLLGLIGVILAIVLRGTKDEEARQGVQDVSARVDNLDRKVDESQRTILQAITASEGRLATRLEQLEQDNNIVVPPAPAPAPVTAPVPPTPTKPSSDQVGHHPVDDGGHHGGARSGGRSRNDEQDAAIAALQAGLAERQRVDEIQNNAIGTHVCRGGHQPVVCQYMAEHFGRQFE